MFKENEISKMLVNNNMLKIRDTLCQSCAIWAEADFNQRDSRCGGCPLLQVLTRVLQVRLALHKLNLFTVVCWIDKQQQVVKFRFCGSAVTCSLELHKPQAFQSRGKHCKGPKKERMNPANIQFAATAYLDLMKNQMNKSCSIKCH